MAGLSESGCMHSPVHGLCVAGMQQNAQQAGHVRRLRHSQPKDKNSLRLKMPCLYPFLLGSVVFTSILCGNENESSSARAARPWMQVVNHIGG